MGPLFSSSVEALRFALNFRDTLDKPADPIMNSMLATQAAHEPVDKATNSRTRGRRSAVFMELTRNDKQVQAGMVLTLLHTLPDGQKHTLIAKYRNAWVVCNCSSVCCSGYKKDLDWTRSLDRLLLLIQLHQEQQRIHGHKGFKTAPPLLSRILLRAFDSKFRASQLEIADVCGVTPATVAAHGKHIGQLLDDWLKDGVTELDNILVSRGIVGATE